MIDQLIDQLIGTLTWLERHGEAVIAAFTIVLALSTIGLWRATRKLYEAGEQQIAAVGDSKRKAKLLEGRGIILRLELGIQ